MRLITKTTGPISKFLSGSTKLFMRLLFIKPNEEQKVSEEEIKLLVKMANQQGVLEQKESEFIQNILRFADRDAYTIMTHRNDVEWVGCKRRYKGTTASSRKADTPSFWCAMTPLKISSAW